MKEFMLMRKGESQILKNLSSDEKQRIMEKLIAFVNRLRADDRWISGSNLGSGFSLYSEKGLTLTDGPFPETKETLNGYVIFKAKDHNEAISIARTCPALSIGERLEMYEMN
jgi:hypothetical protein